MSDKDKGQPEAEVRGRVEGDDTEGNKMRDEVSRPRGENDARGRIETDDTEGNRYAGPEGAKKGPEGAKK